jgi:hypothetical protein
MAMAWECFCLDFAFVQIVVPKCLQWPLAQVFPAAWAGGTFKFLLYLS